MVYRVLLCMLDAVESRFCLLEKFEMLEVTRRVVFCMKEAMESELLFCWSATEGVLCLLEVLKVLETPGVPEVMCCVLLCMLEAVEDVLCLIEL